VHPRTFWSKIVRKGNNTSKYGTQPKEKKKKLCFRGNEALILPFHNSRQAFPMPIKAPNLSNYYTAS